MEEEFEDVGFLDQDKLKKQEKMGRSLATSTAQKTVNHAAADSSYLSYAFVCCSAAGVGVYYYSG